MKEAVSELLPDDDRDVFLKYSKRFKPFNANVRYNSKKIEFRFSHKWKKVDESIQKGLAQHLLAKAFKLEEETSEMRLYRNFLAKLPDYVDHGGPAPALLKESFDRVNEKYFDGFMDKPGLEWGREATTNLGRYSHHTDTIRISTIFKKADEELLDFLIYHELLHKKLGVEHGKKGRCRHHTKEFREKEALFEVEDIEERLKRFVKEHKNGGKLRNIFK